MAKVGEVAIRLRIERLKKMWLSRNQPDVPGLVAEGRSIAEAVEIARGLARRIVESCLEHGDPFPPAFSKSRRAPRELLVPVGLP